RDRFLIRAGASRSERVGDLSGLDQGNRRVVSATRASARDRNLQRRNQHRCDSHPTARAMDCADVGLAVGVRGDWNTGSAVAAALDSVIPRRWSRDVCASASTATTARETVLAASDLGVHRWEVDGGSGLVVLPVLVAKIPRLQVRGKAGAGRCAADSRLSDRRCGLSWRWLALERVDQARLVRKSRPENSNARNGAPHRTDDAGLTSADYVDRSANRWSRSCCASGVVGERLYA